MGAIPRSSREHTRHDIITAIIIVPFIGHFPLSDTPQGFTHITLFDPLSRPLNYLHFSEEET